MLLRCDEPGSYSSLSGTALSVGDIRQALSAGDDQELIVVVPARLTLFSLLQVASHELRHLNLTLPWRFEDQIVDPVESLHFVHKHLQKMDIAVTAIDRGFLESLLAALRADSLLPTAVISEFALVPWKTGSWTVYLSQDMQGETQCLLRYGEHQGMVCSLQNLKTTLQALLNESEQLPLGIDLYCEGENEEALIAQIPQNFQSLLSTHKPALFEPMLSSCCNLLQGRFATPLPWGRWWKQWRVAALMLLALLLGDIAVTGASVWQAGQQLKLVRNEITEKVQEVLPGAVIVDPLLQVRRALAARGGNQDAGFLMLLSRMAPVLEKHEALVVLSMDYSQSSGELQLLIQTGDFAGVEALRSQLQAAGLNAELLGSSSDGSSSRSRLRIRS